MQNGGAGADLLLDNAREGPGCLLLQLASMQYSRTWKESECDESYPLIVQRILTLSSGFGKQKYYIYHIS